MKSAKQLKNEFKQTASKDPDRYYATAVLKKEGFMRKQCQCSTWFWTVNEEQSVCGDPACSGGFRFFEKNPAKNRLDYIGVWNAFAKFFKERGYTPIDRYPVVARWRDDSDFVQASIYDFQPYVVSGEVEPPANPLVVPQFCLRFNDIDNVGITGAHYTGFVMIGQHAFTVPDKYDQEKYFKDIHEWLTIGLGLPKEEITYHEDAWAGGGNFGPCMEYFSRGLELGNQVYMLYEQTEDGYRELKIKVLDMGMGHERNAWFTQGTSTSYETTFPTVCEHLYKKTGIKPDTTLIRKFLPHSSYLNIDEVEDIGRTWEFVAKKMGTDVKTLKEKILPLAAVYSVAEHSRSLLVALSDTALPSNVGGGYNLRVILRRALSFIDQYKWKVSLQELCRLHAEYLKPLFPELSEHLDDVSQILAVEEERYEATKEKAGKIVSRLMDRDITEKDLLQLYDSQGISPEIVREEAEKAGKDIVVPEDFYARVAELHEQEEQELQTKRAEDLNLDDVPDTVAQYYHDYRRHTFKAKVVKIIKNRVILDKTLFYPTSGGQLHDTGTLRGEDVAEVFRQGGKIVHVLEKVPRFKKGDRVEGIIEHKRRMQLAQHHSATHIVNAAAKKVLGNHINQAGAKKDLDKAHLDITHFRSLSDEEMKSIEDDANRIVHAGIPIQSSFMPRAEAEKEFGMGIYQGGAVPGRQLRIVNIEGTDVEACGGTHCRNTSEVGEIKLLRSTKISDGIVRLTYIAGKAKDLHLGEKEDLALEVAKALGADDKKMIPARVDELFRKWKKARKASKKKRLDELTEADFNLESTETIDASDNDILSLAAKTLQTQPDHVLKTVNRFLKDLEEWRK